MGSRRVLGYGARIQGPTHVRQGVGHTKRKLNETCAPKRCRLFDMYQNGSIDVDSELVCWLISLIWHTVLGVGIVVVDNHSYSKLRVRLTPRAWERELTQSRFLAFVVTST